MTDVCYVCMGDLPLNAAELDCGHKIHKDPCLDSLVRFSSDNNSVVRCPNPYCDKEVKGYTHRRKHMCVWSPRATYTQCYTWMTREATDLFTVLMTREPHKRLTPQDSALQVTRMPDGSDEVIIAVKFGLGAP